MVNLVLRLLATVLALKGADYLLSNFNFTGGWGTLLLFGIILGLLNWLVKPMLVIFSFPLIILTIGIFYFFINALILYMATIVYPAALSATLSGIFWGSILISFFNWILFALFRTKKE
jgi:putative membrane protein